MSMRFPVCRRAALGVLACLCGLAYVLGAGIAPGVAAAAGPGVFQFGEEGQGAGQVSWPHGVAVDNDSSSPFYGDVYVSDYGNRRIDRFSGSGAFQLAWGWGVASGANELQTCTTTCQAGPREEEKSVPTHTGAVFFPIGVAVDSDPLSLSAGDVYVVQGSDVDRVEKFGPAGEFLLMFGGGVNETTGGDICSAGEKCTRGTEGQANGEFKEPRAIATGPSGNVYVGDQAGVQVFEPSGAWRETISLAGLSSSGDVTALAVDAAGDVFVNDSGAPGVREFEPHGVEKATQFDPGSTSITGVGVDGSGDVFVGEFIGMRAPRTVGYSKVLKYNAATGKVAGSFGFGTVKGFSEGLAFTEASDAVYAAEFYSPTEGALSSVWSLPVPPPGPSIEGESVATTPPAGALLKGSVNPEGNETKYHFEYVDETDFKTSGFANAKSTPEGTLPASLEGQPVQAQITGLPVSEGFYFRIVASNAESVTPAVGHEESFQSLPAATIGGEFATDVASTSTTLTVEVNALGSDTEYSLEYGAGGYEHTVTGYAGSGTTTQLVSRHLQELAASTTYDYRFVVHNDLGTVASAEQTFRTPGEGGSTALIDGRAWELVSPADKHGALLELNEQGGDVQAASDGSGIAYMAEGNSPGAAPVGKIQRAQVLSRRGSSGWFTEDLTLPGDLPENGERAEALFHTYPEYRLFSPDLSSAAVEPQEAGTALLGGATERTLYLRDNSNGSYLPLVTPADVPPGTQIEEPSLASVSASVWEMQFLAATPDLDHVVFRTPMALTENAVDEETVSQYQEKLKRGANVAPGSNLYEWSSENGERLELVSVLPGSEGVAQGLPLSHVTLAGQESNLGNSYPRGGAPRAISSDGRRVAWTWGSPYEPNENYKGLYVRDMVEEKTVKLEGLYQTMNAEGSKIFYLRGGDLYVYEWEAEKSIDLTGNHGSGERDAGMQGLLSDVSENGSYVYFVATGALAKGAVAGAPNLYLLHDTGGGWSTTLVAVLSGEDIPDWETHYGPPYLAGITSRVSPDGRYLVFMSNRSLTGYDNRNVAGGEPDEEVYLYDAQENKLVCASCDPTGARPTGVYDEKAAELLVDRTGSWAASGTSDDPYSHWLAGSVPVWDNLSNDPPTYQPRYLSDSGRLFFDSPVGLVPQDTNGLEDVYEFEPEGVGNCMSTTSSATEVYVNEVDGSAVGGCVGLISSGTSSSESAFYDASENGDDVFFDTTRRLAPEDVDSAYDVYDAHVCSSAVPCRTAPVPPPPCDSGDSCKAAASAQPTIFGAPASATFSGAGNLAPAAPATVTKKTSKCAKGKQRQGGKCVKVKRRARRKARAKKKRAGRKARVGRVHAGRGAGS